MATDTLRARLLAHAEALRANILKHPGYRTTAITQEAAVEIDLDLREAAAALEARPGEARVALKNGAGHCPHCGGGLQLVKDDGYVLLPCAGAARPGEDALLDELEMALYGRTGNTWEHGHLEAVKAVLRRAGAARATPPPEHTCDGGMNPPFAGGPCRACAEEAGGATPEPQGQPDGGQ